MDAEPEVAFRPTMAAEGTQIGIAEELVEFWDSVSLGQQCKCMGGRWNHRFTDSETRMASPFDHRDAEAAARQSQSRRAPCNATPDDHYVILAWILRLTEFHRTS